MGIAEDTGGTPVVKFTHAPGDPAAQQPQFFVFEPPIEISAGVDIGINSTTATGDARATIGGFVED